MNHFCPTIVVRHRKERLKKCSLRGLEQRKDFLFYSYPLKNIPNSLSFGLPSSNPEKAKPKAQVSVEGYVLLSANAHQTLSKEDRGRGLLLLDATWKLADKMEQALHLPNTVVRRSLPTSIKTAYPRRQNQMHGLASVEALYIAYLLMGKNSEGLLNNYHWKELFLEKNSHITL